MDFFDDLQPCPHRPLHIIFVGHWIAKVDQQPIAQILRNVSFIAADHLGTNLLIGAHHLAQLFGVESLRERGRAHQVTEYHRQLTALSLGPIRVWSLEARV